MSLIAEFEVPADSFALADTLRAVPDARVESDRLATHSREWVLPFVWVETADHPAFQSAMDGDPTVDRYKVVQRDGEYLYNVFWSEPVTELVDQILDQEATVLRASAFGESWRLALRFVTRDQLSTFRDYFREHGDFFVLHNIQAPGRARQREYGLTPEQHETLRVALDAGYFEVPRRTNLEGLADRLGVSSNAASQRLRRATDGLVRNTVAATDRDDAF